MKGHRIVVLLTGTIALGAASAVADGATVAREDFDGGALNLTSSTVPTLDGGGGDTFAVGHTAAWSTTGGTPFSLTDNTVGAVGDTTAFPTDNEGVYGVNSDVQNDFLGISDTREWTPAQTTATWRFNIANATGLALNVDMGSMEGSTFAYDAATSLAFTYSIDGGASVTAFVVTADASGAGFSYRALDNGTVIVADINALVAGGGANPVVKMLADTGLAATNTVLDKTPASGAGAGEMDTFTTLINGTGNELVLALVANLPFEAAAIDNIEISGVVVPEPAGLLLLPLGALALRRHRAVR
jgi:hypothetical protein